MTGQVTLTGQVEHLTHVNEDSGFTVARVKADKHREPVTVVGNFAAVVPGEVLEMTGAWDHHPQYGRQFKVTAYETKVPATVAGIRKYLGSGLIKGIGPVMAQRMTERFGRETLRILDTDIQRLAEVPGIGKKRIDMIRRAWAEQKQIRSLMLFLQSHGVSATYAVKIYKTYGDEALTRVKENPYQMATDIFGIGFTTADRIAEKLGFAQEAPVRIQAGLLYVLSQMAEEGHVYYPYEALLEKCREVLAVSPSLVSEALGEVAREKKIAVEPFQDASAGAAAPSSGVFLAGLYLCETEVAWRLRQLVSRPRRIREVTAPDKALSWVQAQLAMTLAQAQETAIRRALQHKVMIITGGPGTGKTTIVKAVLAIFKALKAKALLAAPTGRAAKKLKEATGQDARTIHRLLEFSPAKGAFQRDADRPLDCDLMVVDEASMIDTVLMHHLLKAVPDWAILILVGDVNQLPSVGPGNVLRDIMASERVPVVTLTEIFRQAEKSRIVVNAHRINQGFMPDLHNEATDSDFFYIEQADPQAVVSVITELVTRRIPRRFGLDPWRDIQVLTPMHKGQTGAANLNHCLQAALNSNSASLARGSYNLAESDKVMQIRNNYDKEVYNGDIGRIVTIDQEMRQVVIDMDGRPITYTFSELDEVVLAYAISVHKSQGSEYPAVVIPVLTQHYILLQRNLLYTAVTRGRRLVVLVGTRKALAIAVGNDKIASRYTRLQQRLRG